MSFSPVMGDSYIGYARVCDLERTWAHTMPWCTESPTGIWIDIFPIDGLSSDVHDKEMDFKEFIHRLASVISAGGNTAAFTRSVFEAILSEEGQDILDEYQPSSYKSFYNGQAKITRLARKINAYIEPIYNNLLNILFAIKFDEKIIIKIIEITD